MVVCLAVVSTQAGKVKEIRVCVKDVIIRTGPGSKFKADGSGKLFKGEKLYVLEEKNGWIKFRVTPKDVGWSGWVPKKSTVLESKSQDQKDEEDIRALKKAGLLKSLNSQMNEALVNAKLWRALEYNTKENIARMLAFYCGRKKGTNLNWVDIKDTRSKKKLAKYSESWGFKIY